MTIYVILGLTLLFSFIVSSRLKSKFEKYSKTPLPFGLSGKEIAEKMLRENGIYDVRVTCVPGQLTDHYDPINKTVNLSTAVFEGHHISAAAVSAHECGHAIQHAESYSFLQMRSKLVPIVSFSSNIMQWVLLAGILLLNTFPSLLLIGILMFAVTTLFSFITLPVEINASQRAVAWLSNTGIVSGQGEEQAKDALKWAAYTYVIAALGSLATLLYYISIFSGRRD
ncbi:MAG: zinc metallopeptidase [Bacteroidota bacterium]